MWAVQYCSQNALQLQTVSDAQTLLLLLLPYDGHNIAQACQRAVPATKGIGLAAFATGSNTGEHAGTPYACACVGLP
jgi:hypothetical protein